MEINNIQLIKPLFDSKMNKIDETPKSGVDETFGKYFKNALDNANDLQVKSNEETLKFITGETSDIHQPLIAAEEARLYMEFVMQVRNKLVESYQERSRMQI